jgi:hypothetical protein
MTVDIVRAVMAAVGAEPSPREIAEVLWLAMHLPPPDEEPPPVTLRGQPLVSSTATRAPVAPPPPTPERTAPKPSAATGRPGSTDPGRVETGRVTAQRPATERAGAGHPVDGDEAPLYSAAQILTGIGNAGEVYVPEAAALGPRLPYHRALRPLKRKVATRNIEFVDELATAEAIADQPAEARIWAPVLRAEQEKWLSLTLVIDQGDSMRIWRRLAHDITAMLTESGVFREIGIWHLCTVGGDVNVRPSGGGFGRHPAELIDPGGRRVILLLSDCTGPAWRRERGAASILRQWGMSAAVAILQPLPERLWRRTAAPTIAAKLTSTRPCMPNNGLTVVPFDGVRTPADTMPVPVVEISPTWLMRWTRMIAGGHAEPGAVTFLDADDTSGQWQLRLPAHPLERVLRFRAQASPQAFRLAGYLAMTDPWLPVMRHVQRAMLGDSTPAYLAEVVLSGLMQASDPEAGRYRFVDDVAEELLNTLSQSETYQVDSVLRRVAAAIDERADRTAEAFPALLGTAGRLAVPPDSRRFALVSPEGRRRLRMIASLSAPADRVPTGSVPPHPLRLLDPKLGVVRFSGRTSALVRLRTWCRGAGPSAYLIIGPGGSGKTRLAHHLVAEQRAAGWRSGFLDDDADLSILDQPGPALVVVDYAEFRRREITDLSIAARSRRDVTRILLLARSTGTWWADLTYDHELMRRAGTDELDPLLPDRASREGAFRAAALDLGVALAAMPDFDNVDWRRLARGIGPPNLTDHSFGSPLNVHLAALVALLEAGLSADARPVTDAVEQHALAHERRYWRDTAASALVAFTSSAVLDTFVAAVALYGAGELAEARAVVRYVLTIADEHRAALPNVVQWLHDLYPGARGEYWGAVEPHPVAEYLVGTVVRRSPPLVTSILPQVSTEQARRAFELLARSFSRFPQLGEAVAQAIAARPERLAPIAVTVVPSAPRAAADTLAYGVAEALIEPGIAVDVIRRIVDGVEDQTPLLRGRDADQMGALIDNYRRLAADGREYQPQLAQALGQLVRVQDEAGAYEEASRALTEQVGLYTGLIEVDPLRYGPPAGRTMLALSHRLAQDGRLLDALQYSTRAATVFRTLADDAPIDYLVELAEAQDARANHLRALYRSREAVSVAVEAVEIWRSLARQHPDQYLSELASSLSEQASAYGEVGNIFNAVNAWTEAGDIYRQLVLHDPERYEPQLAAVLLNAADDLATAGRTRESVSRAAAAADICRRIAGSDPVAYLPWLALAEQRRAESLRQLGDHDGVVAALGAATEALTQVAAEYPDEYLLDQARCNSAYADALVRVNRRSDAAEAFEATRASYRQVVGSDPATIAELVDVLNRLAANADLMGRLEYAIDAVAEMTALLRQVLPADSGDTTTQSTLVGAYEWLARLWDRAGSPGQAERYRKEARGFGD